MATDRDTADIFRPHSTRPSYLTYADLQIPEQGRLVPFALWPTQRLLDARFGERNIIWKERQAGSTAFVVGRFVLNAIHRPGSQYVLIGHDENEAASMFYMAGRFVESLPPGSGGDWNNVVGVPGPRRLALGKYSGESVLDFGAPCQAETLTRGRSLAGIYCSELERWNDKLNLRSILALAGRALSSTGELVVDGTPFCDSNCGASFPRYVPSGMGKEEDIEEKWDKDFMELWRGALRYGYTRHYLPADYTRK